MCTCGNTAQLLNSGVLAFSMEATAVNPSHLSYLYSTPWALAPAGVSLVPLTSLYSGKAL